MKKKALNLLLLITIIGALIIYIEIWSIIRLRFNKTSNSIREPFKTKGDE